MNVSLPAMNWKRRALTLASWALLTLQKKLLEDVLERVETGGEVQSAEDDVRPDGELEPGLLELDAPVGGSIR